ncbi:hypothetical protein C1H46_000353 [Malus baccata]|uniref:Uncharacterized protein n=1 Tax=Malus baccata TaxID=106549 RepID=A0A540NSS4_MALBA|nr:hypothetical protein C1H46_000353 [Malus baccata]
MYGKCLVTGDSELKTIEQLFLLDPALNKTGFVVHGLFEDEPPTNLKIGSIKPCTPTSNTRKQVLTTSTLVPFTPSQSQNQETQLVASNKGVKRTLSAEEKHANLTGYFSLSNNVVICDP